MVNSINTFKNNECCFKLIFLKTILKILQNICKKIYNNKKDSHNKHNFSLINKFL